VLTSNDSEKIENLFKMIDEIIEERKKLFADYNGSYLFYLGHSNKKIPLVTIVINNYEAFIDTYDDYEDLILQYTREGAKYGVVFILSTSSTNAIRYRVRQNFKSNLVLQLNDYSDYTDVIQSRNRKYPSRAVGRGLIEKDGVYEFQTAYPYFEAQMSEYIKVICSRLKNICSGSAPKVPVLPEVVTISSVEEAIGKLSSVPVGINKNNLEIATMDFKNNPVSIISSLDYYAERNFFRTFVKLLKKIPYQKIVVIDAAKMFNSTDVSENYINSNFDSIAQVVGKRYKEQKEIYDKNNFDNNALKNNKRNTYVIFGISTFFSRISSDNKTDFCDALMHSRELEVDNFIIVDSADGLKSFAYDDWYKNAVDTSEGLWLGNGIADQYAIKLLTTPRELREEIPESFGYVVHKGKASLVKLVVK